METYKNINQLINIAATISQHLECAEHLAKQRNISLDTLLEPYKNDIRIISD